MPRVREGACEGVSGGIVEGYAGLIAQGSAPRLVNSNVTVLHNVSRRPIVEKCSDSGAAGYDVAVRESRSADAISGPAVNENSVEVAFAARSPGGIGPNEVAYDPNAVGQHMDAVEEIGDCETSYHAVVRRDRKPIS